MRPPSTTGSLVHEQLPRVAEALQGATSPAHKASLDR